MTKNRDVIREILYTKQEQLIQQLYNRKPKSERLLEIYEKKRKNVNEFLGELEVIIDYLSVRDEVNLARSITEFSDWFNNVRAKKLLFNGKWCKACVISKSKNKKIIILYATSVRRV